MSLVFAWGITNIFKNDNIPFVFFWCDLLFTSELCLIKRHGRPRNVESQLAILSPQSYVFTLLQEKRKLKFDCPNINLQTEVKLWRCFFWFLQYKVQNLYCLMNVWCEAVHVSNSPFPQLYSAPLEVNFHKS